MAAPLNHIFTNILGFQENSYIWEAIIYFGITDAESLIYILPEDIISPYTLTNDDTPTIVTTHIIPKSDARKIIQFINMYKELSPIADEEIYSLTKEDFQTWFQQTLITPETK